MIGNMVTEKLAIDITNVFIITLIIVAALFGLWFIVSVFSEDSSYIIKSNYRVEPELEIYVKEGVSDTAYIYRIDHK